MRRARAGRHDDAQARGQGSRTGAWELPRCRTCGADSSGASFPPWCARPRTHTLRLNRTKRGTRPSPALTLRREGACAAASAGPTLFTVAPAPSPLAVMGPGASEPSGDKPALRRCLSLACCSWSIAATLVLLRPDGRMPEAPAKATVPPADLRSPPTAGFCWKSRSSSPSCVWPWSTARSPAVRPNLSRRHTKVRACSTREEGGQRGSAQAPGTLMGGCAACAGRGLGGAAPWCCG